MRRCRSPPAAARRRRSSSTSRFSWRPLLRRRLPTGGLGVAKELIDVPVGEEPVVRHLPAVEVLGVPHDGHQRAGAEDLVKERARYPPLAKLLVVAVAQ